ncbi:MAG: DUF952 domain-containing protein [Deltaproteobacteria bacterium]|nr:DUF952 domain-containing protein [Deltaproteobacteria bacterium]
MLGRSDSIGEALIYHIVARKDWDAASRSGVYRGDTLETEGFIHCSKLEQVLKVANARFRGRSALVLLAIEPSKVSAEIKHEDGGGGERFPHIYGALNLEAVVSVMEFSPQGDGTFDLPDELRAEPRSIRDVLRHPLLGVPLSLLILCALWFQLRDFDIGVFGQGDFIQYWAGSRLFFGGGNPYDLAQMAGMEAPYKSEAIIILTWNPPIVFPVMAPFALLPFYDAVLAWLIVSCVAFAASLAALFRCIDLRLITRSARVQCAVFLLSFYPVAMSLTRGQLSILLLLSLSAFTLLFLSEPRSARRLCIGGILLSLTMLKPHLLYLVYIWLFARALRLKEWQPVAGLLAGSALLVLSAALFRPEIFSLFASAISTPPIYWKTPTLGSWLQTLSEDHRTVLRFLPTVLTGAFALWCFLRDKTGRLFETSILFILIPLSLLTSPYGWQFDQVLLLPTALWCFARASEGGSRLGWMLIAGNAAIFLSPPMMGMHHFVWYPLVFFVVGNRLRTLGGTEATGIAQAA